jgi:hypothetical protein
MYRYRITVQVRYGRFKDYLDACHQLNEIARARGWTEATFWTPTAGTSNEFVIELDYPDLATFQSGGDAFSADPEAMKLNRSTIDYIVEGTGRSELLQTAPDLA